MAQGRRFTDQERQALYIAADGKCEICGEELSDGWHADHMEPWSKGGNTDVVNGQALCPECNMKKGATVSVELRNWQLRFARAAAKSEQDSFMLVATPASGKTLASCHVVKQRFEKGDIDKVLIVCPTLTVRRNWSRGFAKYGIRVDDRFQNSGVLKRDYDGLAVTYQSLASSPLVYRRLVSRGSWVIIFDEVHHLGTHEDSSWGDAAIEVAGDATYKLMLSGTPFRTDRRQIPFVHYEGNRAIPDFEYTYDEAVRKPDKCVRLVFFKYYDARVEWEELSNGDRRAVSFEDPLNDVETNRRLSASLRALDHVSVVREMIIDAHSELQQIRQDNPMAAGMVLCIDQEHAERIANAMGQWIGIRPVIAVSKDNDATTKIEKFANGTNPWLVSVQMVSEGTDIPRLQVGVYATTTTTEMFWRQAVGRFIRAEYPGDASIYMVADPRLRAMAEHFTKTVDAVVVEEANESLRELIEGAPDEREPLWKVVSAEGYLSGVIHGGDAVDADTMAGIRAFAEEHGMTDAPEKLAFMVQKFRGITVPADPILPEKPELLTRDDEAELRKQNNQIANRIAKRWEVKHEDVNRTLNASVRIHSVRNDERATIEKLRARLLNARDWFDTGKSPR